MSRRKRAYIPLTERLAAALACLLPAEQRNDLRGRKASAREVLKRFEFDHVVFHAPPFNGSDKWHNLDPKLRADHRQKSRLDASKIAKTKRLAADRPETGLRKPSISVSVLGLVQAADAQNAIQRRPKRKIAQRANGWPARGVRKFRSRTMNP